MVMMLVVKMVFTIILCALGASFTWHIFVIFIVGYLLSSVSFFTSGMN